MLSAQLVAMHCNVLAGYVDVNCVLRDRCLGEITVGELMRRSIASLMAHGYTPPSQPSSEVIHTIRAGDVEIVRRITTPKLGIVVATEPPPVVC